MVRMVLIFLCFLLATPAWGEIYKWVDEKGKTHFTDDLRKVPVDQRPETTRKQRPRSSKKKDKAEEDKMKDSVSSESEEQANSKSEKPSSSDKASAGGNSSSKGTVETFNVDIEECGENIRKGKARSHMDTLLDTSQCKEKTIAKAVSGWKCKTGPNQTRFCDNQLASFCSRKYTCVEETIKYNRDKLREQDEALKTPSSLLIE